MSCTVQRDDLWEWLYGDADDADLGAHVDSCEICQQTVAGMRDLMGELDDLPETVEASPALPDSVGDYRILRRIGEGAMGLVFEAEQQTPKRRVALKVIRGGALIDDFRARLFEREMQTLARLNHPSIAAIYDAGVTPDGQTYFAMELVEGITLGEYVHGRRLDGRVAPLPVRARVELFQRICAAINYAHQRGVIHRDLKPANILITSDGAPKILDFGLARASEPDGSSASMVSEAGRLLGTPAYMSPEQTRAQPDELDGRSDVYTLGVMLYELVTGNFPYDVHGPNLVDIVQRICKATPRAPHVTNRQVPVDVSTITMKALEKDAGRRYQTVAELEADVLRYLQRYPIQARPPSITYRVGRYVSRHRLPVALFTTIFLLAFGAAIVFGVLYDRAQREADKFENINEVLTSMMQASDPWQQGKHDVEVREVLDGMAQRIEDEMNDKPLLAGALRYTLGRTYISLGLYSAAEPHLRYAYETHRDERGSSEVETVRRLNDWGEALYYLSDLERSEQLLREALRRRRRLLPPDDPLIGETLNSLGLICKARNNLDEAERLYREALPLRQSAARTAELAGRPHRHLAEAFDAVAQTRNNLAALYRTRANATKDDAERQRLLGLAEGHYAGALQLRLDWLGSNHPETAKMHNNYGKLFVSLRRDASAEPHFREAMRILEAGLGRRHAYTARAMYNLAELLSRSPNGREEAMVLCQAALDVQSDLLQGDHAHLRQSSALLQRLQQPE